MNIFQNLNSSILNTRKYQNQNGIGALN
jgi:hypothetical protein